MEHLTEEEIPEFISIDGRKRRNKWKIPSLLNSEEIKFLISVKKKAYYLDYGCCVGIDPLIGKSRIRNFY